MSLEYRPTKSLLQFFTIASAQTRLLSLLVLAHLAIASTPATAGLDSICVNGSRFSSLVSTQSDRRHIPHLTFLCLHSSHLCDTLALSSLHALRLHDRISGTIDRSTYETVRGRFRFKARDPLGPTSSLSESMPDEYSPGLCSFSWTPCP